MASGLAVATLDTFRGRVTHTDAETLLRSLPDACVDLIATDPPYNMRKAAWDIFDSDAALVAWLGEHLAQMRRVLKPNGSLYVFCATALGAQVEAEAARYFRVLNNIRWAKPPYNTRAEKVDKDTMRAYFPASETIIFAEQYGSDSMALGESQYAAACDELRGFVFEPLRAYLDDERKRAGLTPAQVSAILGNFMYGHYFTRSQWVLPTAEAYARLQEGFNRNGSGEYLRREYEDLRREYEDLRREYEDLRRPFNASPDAPYTDVWHFPTVRAYPGKHPTEKPLDLMRHIVRVSSRPGDVVLDPFCGSGTTLRAAKLEGREYIGGDFDARWVDEARRRLAEPFSGPRQVRETRLDDLPLFAGEPSRDPGERPAPAEAAR